MAQELKRGNYKHGYSKSRIYKIWVNMKSRCHNKNMEKYKIYGGRGITYHNDWCLFKNFYHDMISNYKDNLTLDRIDNNGNYCKENCRWITMKENCRNKRNNNLLYGKTLSEWSNLLKIKRSTLAQRYYVYGWSIDKTLGLI